MLRYQTSNNAFSPEFSIINITLFYIFENLNILSFPSFIRWRLQYKINMPHRISGLSYILYIIYKCIYYQRIYISCFFLNINCKFGLTQWAQIIFGHQTYKIILALSHCPFLQYLTPPYCFYYSYCSSKCAMRSCWS